MKALLVGCGSIGRRHLRNLKSLGISELLAYDTRPERAQEASRESGARPCASLEYGLDQSPELVLVCTPSSLHLQPALAAVRRGSHLFIEKPLSHTLEGIEELEAEAARQRLTVLVGCNMRFHPGIARARELIREGAIGRVICARAVSASYLPDWHPWEDYRSGYSARAELGGGIILDGIHELDYLLDILGPTAGVLCASGRLGGLGIETEDVAEIVLALRSGALASVHLDYISRAYRRSCQFMGTEGNLEWDYDRPEVRLYRASSKSWEALPVPAQDANGMYLDQMRHLLRCLDGKEKPAQDLRAARAALELALAAKRSAQTGARIDLGERSLT